MTSVKGHAPFGRSSNFTNEIHDGTKAHAEALDVIDEISHAVTKSRYAKHVGQ